VELNDGESMLVCVTSDVLMAWQCGMNACSSASSWKQVVMGDG